MNTYVRKTFVLNTESDRDLITWLEAQSNVSETVRAALRAYQGDNATVTHSDIMGAIEALGAKLDSVTITTTGGDMVEDPELANALDNLGL